MLALWSDMSAVFITIFSIIKAIITFPSTAAHWANANLTEIMPSALQWDMNKTASLLIAIACTALFAKYWHKIVGPVGDMAKVVPFIGGFLGIAVPVYMYYILFSGSKAIVCSGMVQALVFLLACIAICAPGYNKWFILAFQRAGNGNADTTTNDKDKKEVKDDDDKRF